MVEQRSKSPLRDTWESAAPGWVKWEHVFAESLKDATDTLIDMAGIKTGARVLDVACGGGSQTIEVAKRVGPDGVVVASDISAAMLDHVRQRAAGEGIKNVETVECAAEEFEEAEARFDAAICRLGLMLFPSPASALTAIHRVLKPGARFAALVFTTPAENPFMAQPMRILLKHVGKEPPSPGQPGIFALGGEGILESLLEQSGLTDLKTVTVRAPLALPNASVVLEMMQQAFGAYRAVIAELNETQRSSAWSDVRACLAQFESNGRFETELELAIGSGAKAR